MATPNTAPMSETESYLRGPFLGALAHAIRSPLGVLQGAVDELKETRDPADLEWLVPMLERGLARLQRLAESLALVRDFEAGRRSAVPQSCDLVSLARRASQAPSDARLQAELDTEQQEIHASCDPDLIELSLRELMDNGQRFAKSQLQVRVAANPEPVIEIVDDGPGLSEEQRKQITERFVSAQQRGAASDLALGLSIASDAAKLGGAQLSLHAAPGKSGLLCRLRFAPAEDDG